MNTQSFLIEHQTTFTGNGGPYNEQPVFVLSSNSALTGADFVAVSRVRTSINDGASGFLVLHLGTSGQLYSASGARNTFAQSITADGSTGEATQYTITTVVSDKNRIDVILNDGGVLHNDISLTGFTQLESLNYLGSGFRPGAGADLIGYYTYNREELGTGTGIVVDRSAKSLNMSIKGAASGDGTSATITGWTFSPVDGGFRLEGKSWLESSSSNFYNPVTSSFSGLSVLTHAKFSTTGNTNLFSVGSGTTEIVSLKENSGVLTLKTGTHTVTGGPVAPGKWYTLGLTMAASGNLSGVYLYVNGTSASFTGITDFPHLEENARLVIGKDMDLVSSGLTGVVGLTRIFNRPLSGQEMMLNYVGTIPSYMRLNRLRVG